MFSQRQIGKILLLLCCLLLSSTTFATTKNPPTSLINSSIASKTELKAKEQTSDGYYLFEDNFESGLDEKIWVEKMNIGIHTEKGTLIMEDSSPISTSIESKELDLYNKFTFERKVKRKSLSEKTGGEFIGYTADIIFNSSDMIRIHHDCSSDSSISYIDIFDKKYVLNQSVWNDWNTEKIKYDDSNGKFEYYLNDKLVFSTVKKGLNFKKVRIRLIVWGFYTVAREETEYIRYTTEKPSSCDFTDVDSSSPYYAPTNFLCERGVLSGAKADGAVKVEDKLTRAQLAKIGFRGLYLTNGRQVPSAVPSDNFPSIYPDISHRTADNEYYYQAARALMYLEYGDGISPFDRDRVNFEPGNTISRIHVLKALCETFNIKPDLSGTSNPFPGDAEAVALQRNNPVKFGYLRRAAALGLIATPEGDKNTKFRPHDDCLRGEAFLMLARIMKAIEAGQITDPNPSTADYFEPLNLTTQTLALGLGLSMGNFNHYTKSSFALDGVAPLGFSHEYNSYNTTLPDAFYASRDSKDRTEVYQPLGPGWSHSYHTFITFAGHGKDARAIVHWGGGNLHVYQSDGTKFRPESAGVYDDMTITSDGITIRTKDKMTYAFDKQGTAPGTTVLYLTSITDRNGNRLSLRYAEGTNGTRVISSVSDGHRELKFTYKAARTYWSKWKIRLGAVSASATPSMRHRIVMC